MKRLLLVFIASFCLLNCVSAQKGPLFVQVHFTNSIRNITSQQLQQILTGKITNFKEIGGENRSIAFFVEKSLAENIKTAFPAFPCKAVYFNFDNLLIKNRSFVGISDINGLRPYFKTVYIDNELPWGKIAKNYVLSQSPKNNTYSFTTKGAPVWEPGKATIVVQTGVTAMTRGFVPATNRSGKLYSSIEFTKDITRQADLATTSNEVSFLDPCTYKSKSLRFCSPKKFFTVLTEAGFDIIELTGNHNNDFGPRHNESTINMYTKAGLAYFGGGLNQQDAERILYKKVKEHSFAFLGANEFGPRIAWATKNMAGAAKVDKASYTRNIMTAAKNSNIIFVTMQSGNENDPRPWKSQVDIFHSCVDAGATIVVSSSAHRAMGLEFYKGKLISYGLGNFLFDQMHTINHRRGMIARHHIYNGRHIQTELIPYLIYNYSQPRTVSGKQARDLMDYVFAHSKGPVFQ